MSTTSAQAATLSDPWTTEELMRIAMTLWLLREKPIDPEIGDRKYPVDMLPVLAKKLPNRSLAAIDTCLRDQFPAIAKGYNLIIADMNDLNYRRQVFTPAQLQEMERLGHFEEEAAVMI